MVEQVPDTGTNGTGQAGASDGAGTTPAPTTPTAAAKPLEGKTDTGEKFGGISELVAYWSLEDAADKIAPEVIRRVEPRSVIVIAQDRDVFASNTAYEQVTKALDTFEAAFRDATTHLSDLEPLTDGDGPRSDSDLIRDVAQAEALFVPVAVGAVVAAATKVIPIATKVLPAAISALPKATAAIASLADLIGMFKVNAVIRSPEIKVSVDALTALIASRLVSPNDGKVVHASLAGGDIFEDSPLLGRFVALTDARRKLEEAARIVRYRDVQARERKVEAITKSLARIDEKRETAIAEGKSSASELETLAERLTSDLVRIETETYAERRADIESAEALIKAWDQFVSVITTPPASAPTAAPLALAAGAERLRAVNVDGERKDVTHVLFLAVSSAKAEAATRQGTFIIGPEGRFTGGTHVTWVLVDRFGAIKASGATAQLRFIAYDLDDGKITKRSYADLGGDRVDR